MIAKLEAEVAELRDSRETAKRRMAKEKDDDRYEALAEEFSSHGISLHAKAIHKSTVSGRA